MGLKETIFKNHKIPSSYLQTLLIFGALFIFFTTLSVVISVSNSSIKQYEYQYSQICGTSTKCKIDLEIQQDLPKVFIYYRITNYFQNYRLYLNSKSNKQLNGKQISKDQAESSCGLRTTNSQMNKTHSVTKKPLKPDDVAFPCGVIADSIFTDNYALYQAGSKKPIQIDTEDYPFYGTKGNMYKNWDLDKQWINIESSRFIQWMQVAGTSDFQKYYGQIQNGLKKNSYTLYIDNTWDVQQFQGKKYIVITTSSTFGGKNVSLEVIYWFSTIVCLAFIVVFQLQRNRIIKDINKMQNT